jgi:hypothetical protein
VNYDAIPSVIYTFPKRYVANRKKIKAAGIAYKVDKFPSPPMPAPRPSRPPMGW